MQRTGFVSCPVVLDLSREKASRLCAVLAVNQPFCCSNKRVIGDVVAATREQYMTLLQQVESSV